MKAEGRRQKAEAHVPRARRRSLFLPFAFCLLPSLLIVFLLGCARKNDGRIHIEFWALGREGEEVTKLVRDFEKLNPGIAVDVQQMPWTAAHEKFLTSIV